MFKPSDVSAMAPSRVTCKQRRRRYAITFGAGVVALGVVLGAITWILKRYCSSSPSEGVPMTADGVEAPGVNGEAICDTVRQDAGYIQLANKVDGHYFYWFFESRSRPKEDPLVLWLSGGPGCSSLWPALVDNGPCTVQPDLSTRINPHSWNSNASIIYLDQPLFTGFSYGKIPDDYDTTSTDVSESLYWFLQGFFTKHPRLRQRPLYLAGRGEAAQFIPVAAYAIAEKNKQLTPANATFGVNLKGVVIGNGLTVPSIQFKHYLDIATNNSYNVSLASDAAIQDAESKQSKCLNYIEQCQSYAGSCLDAAIRCRKDLQSVFNNASRNLLNIRLNCSNSSPFNCYSTPQVDSFLNSPSVQSYLNVRTGTAPQWSRCNYNVSKSFAYAGDVMKDRQRFLGRLLDSTDIRVLIYAGDADAQYNWFGIDAWTKELEWSGQDDIVKGAETQFITSDGAVAGTLRESEAKFVFARVSNAGYYVAMDQPQAALEMLNRFLSNQSLQDQANS